MLLAGGPNLAGRIIQRLAADLVCLRSGVSEQGLGCSLSGL
ncbi:hypothetical protein [Streptomyces formicae]